MKAVVEAARAARRALILNHASPDGDAVGSAYAMKLLLENCGVEAVWACEHGVPADYTFCIPPEHCVRLEALEGAFDTAFVLDCGAVTRLGSAQTLLPGIPTVVNIDHHPGNDGFGSIRYVCEHAPATSEIIAELYAAMRLPLSVEAACALLLGMAMDTGNFIYPSTTANTRRLAARLQEIIGDAQTSALLTRLFRSRSLSKTLLLTQALSTLKIENRLALMYITQSMLIRCEATSEDCENIIDFAREIQGVRAGILLKQRSDGVWRVSIRTEKPGADVAARALGGGGHALASGCTVALPLSEAVRVVISAVDAAVEK